MTWLWTDELARVLIEHGGIEPRSVESAITRPYAVHAPDEAEPLEVARMVFGVDEAVAGAA